MRAFIYLAERAVIWTSPDGLTWHRMTAAQAGLDPNGQDATPASPMPAWIPVAVPAGHGADASGQEIVVGSADGITWQPAVWTTADGSSWTTAVLPLPGGASGVLQQIAIDGNRVVALGTATAAGAAMPLAEVSADGGGTWCQVPSGAPGGDVAVPRSPQTGLERASAVYPAELTRSPRWHPPAPP